VLHESLSGVKPFAAGSVDIIDILSAIKKVRETPSWPRSWANCSLL
jgi:hypothetical protein